MAKARTCRHKTGLSDSRTEAATLDQRKEPQSCLRDGEIMPRKALRAKQNNSELPLDDEDVWFDLLGWAFSEDETLAERGARLFHRFASRDRKRTDRSTQRQNTP